MILPNNLVNTEPTDLRGKQGTINQRNQTNQHYKKNWSKKNLHSHRIYNVDATIFHIICCDMEADILFQLTGLPWRDLQADWNSRVRSRHVILPLVNDHQSAVETTRQFGVLLLCCVDKLEDLPMSGQTRCQGGVSFLDIYRHMSIVTEEKTC